MGSERLLESVVRAADAKKAMDIVALDVSQVSGIADSFVIMEAMNMRQIRALVTAIDETVSLLGIEVGGKIEGQPESGWVLMDLGDVIVNIFDRDSRLRFNLEKLWSDAASIDLEVWVTD